jgi:DNA invertase Pin-like site-specific DNA recombinase
VDAIFEYLLREHPAIAGVADSEDLKRLVRDQFGGQRGLYIRRGKSTEDQRRRVDQILELFNGRNASEIARRLGIGRATVYRLLKQARRDRVSRVPVT